MGRQRYACMFSPIIDISIATLSTAKAMHGTYLSKPFVFVLSQLWLAQESATASRVEVINRLELMAELELLVPHLISLTSHPCMNLLQLTTGYKDSIDLKKHLCNCR